MKMVSKMKNRQSGFTLVELSIVMLIAGIILSTMVKSYDLYQSDKPRKDTLERIEKINSEIAIFHAQFGRYPCPARLTAQPGDADYGQEIDCTNNVPPLFPVVTPIGVDRTLSMDRTVIPFVARDANQDGVDDGILIGAVPFVTRETVEDPPLSGIFVPVRLDLSSEDILDGWSNKLTYAVSETLVKTDSFNESLGAISVEDEFGNGGGREPSLVDPPGSVHYVVKSAGFNGRGAYTPGGQPVGDPCTGGSVILPSPPAPPAPPVSSGETIEYENCDDDDLFISALKNDVEGNTYNDDIVSFQLFISPDLWEYAPGVGVAGPTFPGSIRNRNIGNVYIGRPALPDADDALVYASGRLKSQAVRAVRVCGIDGSVDDCFEPGLLGGDGNRATEVDPDVPGGVTSKRGLRCSNPNHALIGIVNNKPVCSDPFSGLSSIPDQTCTGKGYPAGSFIVSITNNGDIICKVP